MSANSKKLSRHDTFESESADVYTMKMASRRLTATLVIILKVYVICGGFLFRALESDNETKTIARVKQLYENITSALSSSDCPNSTQVLDAFHKFLAFSGQYSDVGGLKATQPKWNYEGAFFFSYTVVTTVGYGKLAPATTLGRLVFIVYALFGIPLCLTVLHQIAAYSHQCAVWVRIGATLRRHRIGVVIGYVLAGILLIYVPSVLISYEEGWTYLDSIYYVFVTVFTVGFGDLVAGQQADAIPLYRYFLACWFLLGIAYMTSVMRFLNGLDAKLARYCSRKVYIEKKKSIMKDMPLPESGHWAVKVQ